MIIEHIFFDLDHTLWDFERNSAKTFDFILNENEIQVNLEDFLDHYVLINKKYWKLYREERVSKSELRYKRLKETFEALNYKVSDDQINHLAKTYIDNLSNYNHLFEGTLEILEYLALKYQMHIITNGFEDVQLRKLKNSEILHFFDKIVTSEYVGVKKPNSKIFNHAIEIAGTSPEKSIMVGDNLQADIIGAQQVGMKTIFFNPLGETGDNNTISIAKLIEIKQYL